MSGRSESVDVITEVGREEHRNDMVASYAAIWVTTFSRWGLACAAKAARCTRRLLKNPPRR